MMDQSKSHFGRPAGRHTLLALGLLTALAAHGNEPSIPSPLTLEQAIAQAQQQDPWQAGNRHSQTAMEAMSVAAGELPDPKMSLALANLPTDSFDFNQEAMTQVNLGITQMLPRGDTLALKRQQLTLSSEQFPFQRQDRQAMVAVNVSELWLDAYLARESKALVEKNRALFLQLADIAKAGYTSGLGKARQQDLIRAQLELTRLDDRLTMLTQQQEMAQQRLAEWLRAEPAAAQPELPPLSKQLPELAMAQPRLYQASTAPSDQELAALFAHHPAIQALERKIRATDTGIALAEQKYKPEWGVGASYGYRGEDPMGRDRADLVSVGVTFDLPLFTAKRQDQELSAAVSQTEAVKTEQRLLLRKLMAGLETTRARLQRLDERRRLYREQLLPQMHEQAEAALTAYTNDTGDFAETVRARIAELDATIVALGIEVERQKAIAQWNYFFVNNDDHRQATAGHAGA